MLDTNKLARVGRVTRLILDHYDAQARKLLRWLVDAEQRIGEGYSKGAFIMFNIYGGEAAVLDIVRTAERHRAVGRMEEAA